MRILILTILITALVCGCSGKGIDPTTPYKPAASRHEQLSHAVWGLWQGVINPGEQTLQFVQVRTVDFHLNALFFLEPPPLVNLTLESLKFIGNNIEADIGLRHPFLGLTEFTGFDVCGILITNGSVSGFSDTKIKMAGGGDTRLLNPDGYSRWWNPVEFPVNNGTMFSYKDGLLGTPDSKANYNSTLNAYKYFCDDLGPDDPLTNVTLEKRGMFSPGKKNIRHYTIEIGNDGLVFNYAVDACWLFPTGSKPWTAPDDFPPGANRPEAWRLGVTELSNSLWNNGTSCGGELHLSIDVYDWFNGGLNSILVESPGNFSPVTVTTPSGEGPGYSTYTVDITSATPQASGPMDILISVVSEQENFQEFINGINTTAYFIHATQVASGPLLKVIDPNGGETLWMAMSHEIKWDPGPGGIADVKIEWSTDNFVSDNQTIVASTPNDGSFIWQPIPNVATATAKVRVSDVMGTASGTSDNYFTIAKPVWLDFQEEVGVSDSTVTWNYSLPYLYEQWFDEISPALSQDLDGPVHLCWHGETVDWPPPSGPWMAHDVTIRSTNGNAWNGEADCLHSEGGSPEAPLRTDNLKLAAASSNTTFAAVRLFTLFFVPDVDAWPDGNHYYNNGYFAPYIEKNCELMADDTYLYMIGDHPGSGIYCQRVVAPSWPDWTWYPTSVVTYTDNGEVSHVRSWAIQSGQLVLAFYTTSGQIKLLRQTDQASDTWDDTEVIFDGSGYTDCKDPSVAVDGDGRLFAVWTGKNSSTNLYEILASMKDTKTGTWTTPIVATSSDSAYNDTSVTISAEKVLLPTGDSEYMVLIGYENNGVIQSCISPKDLWAFLPEQEVDTGVVTAQEPDVLCPKAPYTFDALFTWSFEVTPGDLGIGDHDIKFRNADFKTP